MIPKLVAGMFVLAWVLLVGAAIYDATSAHAQEPAIAAIQVPRELVESALNAQQELNTWAAIARYTSGQIEGYCTKRGMAVRRDGLWCDPVVKEQSK